MGSSSPDKEFVYDDVRRTWVSATKEEQVRQNLIQKMMQGLSYPRELLAVEVLLSDLCKESSALQIPLRRVDLVCFFPHTLLPLLVVECKERAGLQEEALEQVQGYNCYIQAPFVAIAHPEGEMLAYRTEKGFSFLPYLPKYPDLVRAVGHG